MTEFLCSSLPSGTIRNCPQVAFPGDTPDSIRGLKSKLTSASSVRGAHPDWINQTGKRKPWRGERCARTAPAVLAPPRPGGPCRCPPRATWGGPEEGSSPPHTHPKALGKKLRTMNPKGQGEVGGVRTLVFHPPFFDIP